MIQAIRQTVTVQSAGRIEIEASELPEGVEAEVIVLVNEAQAMQGESIDVQGAIETAQQIIRQHVPEGQLLSEELIQERRAASQHE